MNRQKLTVKIQTNLKKLGFFSSKVDGYTGPMTRKSVKAFQMKYGFSVDTKISETLFKQTIKGLEEKRAKRSLSIS